jgi:hypothetical protein
MAIDTGRPFLIQDVNTDVPLPLELDDSWLSQYMNTRCTSSQLHKEIELELQQRTITPLPHIAAMVDYSRVVSKMWEAHYGASDQNRGSSPLTDEYLEFLVSSTVEKAPSRVWSGSRQPFHVQFAGMEWWQIKQKMLMRIVCPPDCPRQVEGYFSNRYFHCAAMALFEAFDPAIFPPQVTAVVGRGERQRNEVHAALPQHHS